MKDYVALNVNGNDYLFPLGEQRGQIPYSETLIQTLRDRLGLGALIKEVREGIGLTGAELSCGEGYCGRCAVLIEGVAIVSCMTLTSECDGKKIITFEGLQQKRNGKPDPVVEAVLDYPGFQCRMCTPGIIIAVRSLFNKHPHPSDNEIKEGLSGNYCRLEKECGIRTRLVAHLSRLSAAKDTER